LKIDSAIQAHRSIDRRLRDFLGKLAKEQKVVDNPIGYTNGIIPVGPPLGGIGGNVILVGDAAAHTHSVLGAGIFQALRIGTLAGAQAAKAVKSGNLETLTEYQKIWRAQLGAFLDQAYRDRSQMETGWFAAFESVTQKYWTFA
jgi:flavin-dependent dehydrogenase